MKLNKQIFGWMGASALMLTTACANEQAMEPQVQDMEGVYGSGSSIITLNITPDAYVGTRSISDGTNAKQLYFEVYEVDKDGKIITGTATTPGTDTQADGSEAGAAEESAAFPLNNFNSPVPVKDYKATIKMAVDPDKNYKIALWATSKEAMETKEVFTLSAKPLTVTVNYDNATNNYEAMDAFCGTQEFGGEDGTVNVLLHRPFAQLNVGTSGADYKNYMQGNIYPNRKVLFSKMVVNGVCNTLDVANDKISNSTGFDGKNVILKPAYLPAFNTKAYDSTLDLTNKFEGEEFLKVKLNAKSEAVALTADEAADEDDEDDNVQTPSVWEPDADGFYGYKNTYPTMAEDGTFLTETFRYLCMAYVLVPSEISSNATAGSYDIYKGSTLESVDIHFGSTDKDTYKYFTVKNVPVHRNWRTNLLGGLANTTEPKDPTDPEPDPNEPEDPKPDDPSSVFYNIKVLVNLCPIYFGENNGTYDPDKANNWFGVNSEEFPSGSGTLHDHDEEEPTPELPDDQDATD